jgi:hypothetical protein
LSWLGTGLTLLLALAWLSAVPYLLVRAGTSSPVALATADAVHLYVGSAMVALIVAKVRRAGLRTTVPGVQVVSLWQRWLSWSLGVGYGAVVVTGALALIPWSSPVRNDLADAHLIVAVWMVVPTTWHVLHHRRRAYARLRRLSGIRWLGLALVVLPLGAVVPLARAVAEPTQTGAGATWTAVGPQVFLDRLSVAPDGRHLVAGGSGLFVGEAGDSRWVRVGPFSADDPVLGLDLPGRGRFGVLVGAADGLWGAARLGGPYQRLPLPVTDVHAATVAPALPDTIWASSDEGMWRSTDGGRRWEPQSAGLADPASAWSLGWSGPRLFGSDGRAVYMWSGASWVRSSAQWGVVMLDAVSGRRLVASSMGDGMRSYDGRSWRPTQAGLTVHAHGSGAVGVHVVSVSFGSGEHAYAGTMEDGVEVSLDGGRTWSQAWPQLARDGVAWRVLPMGSQLVAATDRGMLAYHLPAARPAGWWWWLAVAGGGLVIGGLAVVLSAAPRAVRGDRAL